MTSKRLLAFMILLLSLTASPAWARKLVDVKILGITPAKDSFELKLHASRGPKGSYFLVEVSKADPASFDKLAFVIKKLEQGDRYRLDLDIPSFSMSPSGSVYRSESVRFFGGEAER